MLPAPEQRSRRVKFFQYYESGGDRFECGIAKMKNKGHRVFGLCCSGQGRLQKEQGEERSQLGVSLLSLKLPTDLQVELSEEQRQHY